ncbi:MAG TPA: hypothetical protein VK306_09195 [Acidimicrobiales bacterium]|nr:hypothetical protein [Acidimicrobiales bacterium]
MAEGVPLTIALTVLDVGAGCMQLRGAAVYLWHCDRDGGYSLYSDDVSGENYLRGVQEAGRRRHVELRQRVPGGVLGPLAHIHFEVFAGLDEATGGGTPLVTSQIALPDHVCEQVYAAAGYEPSVRNLAQTSLESDNVFSDGHDQQLATVTGAVDTGFTASLTVAV